MKHLLFTFVFSIGAFFCVAQTNTLQVSKIIYLTGNNDVSYVECYCKNLIEEEFRPSKDVFWTLDMAEFGSKWSKFLPQFKSKIESMDVSFSKNEIKKCIVKVKMNDIQQTVNETVMNMVKPFINPAQPDIAVESKVETAVAIQSITNESKPTAKVETVPNVELTEIGKLKSTYNKEALILSNMSKIGSELDRKVADLNTKIAKTKNKKQTTALEKELEQTQKDNKAYLTEITDRNAKLNDLFVKISMLENPLFQITQPKVEIAVAPIVEKKIETKIEPKVEIIVAPIVEKKVETKIEPKVEIAVAPVVEKKIETKIEPKVEIIVAPIVEKKVETKIEPKLEIVSAPFIEKRVEKVIEKPIETNQPNSNEIEINNLKIGLKNKIETVERLSSDYKKNESSIAEKKSKIAKTKDEKQLKVLKSEVKNLENLKVAFQSEIVALNKDIDGLMDQIDLKSNPIGSEIDFEKPIEVVKVEKPIVEVLTKKIEVKPEVKPELKVEKPTELKPIIEVKPEIVAANPIVETKIIEKPKPAITSIPTVDRVEVKHVLVDCADLQLDSIWLVGVSKKVITVNVMIRNNGNKPYNLYGPTRFDDDNVAIRFYLNGNENLTRGAIGSEGAYVMGVLDQSNGILQPNQSIKYTIKFNGEERTTLTPYVIGELNPFGMNDECNPKNNYKSLLIK